MVRITSRAHPNYARAIELINKTNQFNTTGIRWSDAKFEEVFIEGGYVVAFAAVDNTADYGLVAVGVVSHGNIRIFVMSCRVIGLDVELAALRMIEATERESGRSAVQSQLIDTERNTLSRDLFARACYIETCDVWHLSLSRPMPMPPHITPVF